MEKEYTVFALKNIQAPNFIMTPLELKDYIDFEVKRVYFICKPINEKQSGRHAHIALEDELFVLVAGTCTAILDDGTGLEEIDITAPQTAIKVPHMVWHGFKNFSDDAVLLAITSTNYNPNRSDYCEDYTQFQELVKKNKQ
jgi:uncharacterized cupin superfamily protein